MKRPAKSHITYSVLLGVAVVCCLVMGLPPIHSVDAAPRSSKWESVRNAYIESHPSCIYCGKPATQIHHIQEFSQHRELELVESNLISLCAEHHGENAHLGYHYKCWNPLIEEEAALHRAMVEARPHTDQEAAAFVKRFRKCFEAATYQVSP